MFRLNYQILFKQAHSGKSLKELLAIKSQIEDNLTNESQDGEKLRHELGVVQNYIDEVENSIASIKRCGRHK